MRKLVFKVILPLILSITIYLLFRPITLKGYNLLNPLLIKQLIGLRSHFFNFSSILPNWVIYSLPDGLWIYSFTNAMLLLFDNKSLKILFASVPIIMAYMHELCQLVLSNYGTFDVNDLILYSFFYLIAISSDYITKILLILKKNK